MPHRRGHSKRSIRGSRRGNRQAQRISLPRKGKCVCTPDPSSGSDACRVAGYNCNQHQSQMDCDFHDLQGCSWRDVGGPPIGREVTSRRRKAYNRGRFSGRTQNNPKGRPKK